MTDEIKRPAPLTQDQTLKRMLHAYTLRDTARQKLALAQRLIVEAKALEADAEFILHSIKDSPNASGNAII